MRLLTPEGREKEMKSSPARIKEPKLTPWESDG